MNLSETKELNEQNLKKNEYESKKICTLQRNILT